MNVGQRCSRPVLTARPGDPVRAVAVRMQQRGVDTVVVVDADRCPIGVVTDRDLVLRVIAADRLPTSTRIEDVMTRNPPTVRESDAMEQALDALRRSEARRLTVVDDSGHLVGVLDESDLGPPRAAAARPSDAAGRRRRVVEAIARSTGDPEC